MVTDDGPPARAAASERRPPAASVLLLSRSRPDPEALGGVAVHVAALAGLAPVDVVRHSAWVRGSELFVERCGPRRLVAALPLDGDRGLAGALVAALAGTGANVLHVHSPSLGGRELAAAVGRTGVRAALTLHDHSLICENHQLLEGGERYCGVPRDLGRCDLCLAKTRDRPPGSVPIYREAMRALVESSDAFVAPSESVLEHAARVHPEVRARAHRIPWGVPPPRAQCSRRATESGALRIAVVGLHAAAKGAGRLPALLSSCRGLDVEWHLFGATEGASLREVKRSAPRVFAHGFIPGAELAERLRDAGCHLAMLPSVFVESFSLVLSEVVAAGLPVLASELGALGERTRAENMGWTFDPWAPDAFRLLVSDLAKRREAVDGIAHTLRARPVRTEEDMIRDHVALWKALARKAPNPLAPSEAALADFRRGAEAARAKRESVAARLVSSLRRTDFYRDLPLRRALQVETRRRFEETVARWFDRAQEMTALDRRLGWAVFGVLFASYAYFYSAGGWNENSRFDLVRAVVEEHSISIDRFHRNTGDKALVSGHYYSDKAPGLSFVAVPVYAILRATRPLFTSEHDFLVIASYLLTILTVGAAGALTGSLVYRAGRRVGASPRAALLGALGYGLGTTAFPLSTMFFGHQFAALVLFAAFHLAEEAKEHPAPWRSTGVLLLCAASPVVEFPTAPAAAIIVAYHTGLRMPRKAWLFAAAGALPVLLLALYLSHAFGSPFRVGYGALADPGSRTEMLTRGLFGVSLPKPRVLAELLIGRHRGLLPYSPILLFAIPGFVRWLANPGRTPSRGTPPPDKKAGWIALSVVVYFLLFVSGYEWWQGGASFGSRHLAPMLPFLALPVALVADVRPKLSTSFTIVSIGFMTIVTAVQPKPAESYENPFWEYELPAFIRGDLATSNACPVIGSSLLGGHEPLLVKRGRDSFNLGMLLGASGKRSLALLVALWIASAWALFRASKPERV